MHAFKLIIDGEMIGPEGRTFVEVVNPATSGVLGKLPCATADDLDRAAAAVQRSFAGWKALGAVKRSAILRKAAEIVRERADVLARVLTTEQGKPLRESLGEIEGVAETFEWFAEEGRRRYGRLVSPGGDDIEVKVNKVPVGPVLILTPWNFPVGEVATHLAPALAAGCTAIVKATEEAPSATTILVEILHEAGIPAGVVNLVYGNPAMISQHLIAAPQIRKIAFTGSVAVGRELAALAGRALKPATLELGGNAPAIVCGDADLEAAADAIALRKFRNAGQVCVSPNRIFVADALFDPFVERLASKARALRVGSGLDTENDMGPMANNRRLDIVLGMVRETVARGAKLVCGGARIGNAGCFMEPTVLTDVPDDAPAWQEEIFGPVASVNRFSALDEVLERANSVPVGLASYVFTRSLDTAKHLSEGLDFGMVGVNTLMVGSIEVPFGGVKDSGFGRTCGTEGLDEFLVAKTVTTRFTA